jgi:site-specific DNA-methyltransferase (cytosine-N4-specific)
MTQSKTKPHLFYKAKHGKIFLGDSLDVLETMKVGSVDLVMTSPPFGLVRKKEYGNADAHEYLDWFTPIAPQY